MAQVAQPFAIDEAPDKHRLVAVRSLGEQTRVRNFRRCRPMRGTVQRAHGISLARRQRVRDQVRQSRRDPDHRNDIGPLKQLGVGMAPFQRPDDERPGPVERGDDRLAERAW